MHLAAAPWKADRKKQQMNVQKPVGKRRWSTMPSKANRAFQELTHLMIVRWWARFTASRISRTWRAESLRRGQDGVGCFQAARVGLLLRLQHPSSHHLLEQRAREDRENSLSHGLLSQDAMATHKLRLLHHPEIKATTCCCEVELQPLEWPSCGEDGCRMEHNHKEARLLLHAT